MDLIESVIEVAPMDDEKTLEIRTNRPRAGRLRSLTSAAAEGMIQLLVQQITVNISSAKLAIFFLEKIFWEYLWSTTFILFVFLLVSGRIGAGFGVRSLFHDDPEMSASYSLLQSPDAATGFGLVVIALIVSWFVSLRILRKGELILISKLQVAIASLIFIAGFAFWRIDAEYVLSYNIALGAIIGIGSVYALLFFTIFLDRLGIQSKKRLLSAINRNEILTIDSLGNKNDQISIVRTYADIQRILIEMFAVIFVWLPVSVVIAAVLWFKFFDMIPSLAIFILIIMIYLSSQFLSVLPPVWKISTVSLIFTGLYFGSGAPYKLQFAGLVSPLGRSHYETPLGQTCLDPGSGAGTCPALSGNASECASEVTRLVATLSAKRECKSNNNSQSGLASPLIEPIATLEAWRRQFGSAPPKLVLVATSGGAYRAAYWTGMVLDKLAAESSDSGAVPDFDRSIRFLAGASGGMVGAAYFAALAADPQNSSSVVSALSADVGRDSLSPVVEQLVRRDIASVFRRQVVQTDRGKILEEQWPTLQMPFSDLRRGESQGWRPSLIFSPTLIETGQPLIISNLQLRDLEWSSNEEAKALFDLFPCSVHTFKVSTATRMNASFPYVSPAVNLPTCEQLRVADAGYYDNYGIPIITGLLEIPGLREWIGRNTSGIVILQIRSSTVKLPRRGEPCITTERAESSSLNVDWLTSPLEGGLTARNSSMIFRNQQALRLLKEMYASTPIEIVTFENAADVSLNWYISEKEIRAMYECLDYEWRINVDRLKRFWTQ